MENIREIRKAIGLSQHELADMLGLSRSLLSLVETGQRHMPTSALLRLTQLRISTEQSPALVSAEENPPAEDDALFIREEIQLRLDRTIALRENMLRERDDMSRRFLAAELGAAMLQKEMALYEGVTRVTQKLEDRQKTLNLREQTLSRRTHANLISVSRPWIKFASSEKVMKDMQAQLVELLEYQQQRHAQGS